MANPTLREGVFNSKDLGSGSVDLERPMSVSGTLVKTLFLTLFMALTFGYTWALQIAGFGDKVQLLSTAGVFGGFIVAMIICFAPKNKFLALSAPIYAMLEGLFLGGISALFNMNYPGIVFQAVFGTLLAIVGMYVCYSTKLLRATDTFRKVIFISTFAIAGIYILQLILSFFRISIPLLFTNSPMGILFSAVVVIIAALNLVLDFDFIERASENAPKYMEWYGAFSLMVTIVWLYIEILRLLSKIYSRR